MRFVLTKTEHAPAATIRQAKILAALRGGEQTWDELRACTKASDDNLGLALCEMLYQRMIWTGRRGGVRVYGIERREWLTHQTAHRRRVDESQVQSI